MTEEPTGAIERRHMERIRQCVASLSLGEVQLLLLGLWVIGDENRVDPRLETEYRWLITGLRARANETIGLELRA